MNINERTKATQEFLKSLVFDYDIFNTKFVGSGSKLYIAYDSEGVEVPNFFIRSNYHHMAEKTAKKLYGDKASVCYTEIKEFKRQGLQYLHKNNRESDC